MLSVLPTKPHQQLILPKLNAVCRILRRLRCGGLHGQALRHALQRRLQALAAYRLGEVVGRVQVERRQRMRRVGGDEHDGRRSRVLVQLGRELQAVAPRHKKYDVPESTKGVIVTQIDPESPSYAAGIREGDVIHEIKKEAVTTSKQAVELSEKVKKDKTVLLRVSTKGSSRFVVVAQKE